MPRLEQKENSEMNVNCTPWTQYIKNGIFHMYQSSFRGRILKDHTF